METTAKPIQEGRSYPFSPLFALDTLWLQVAGTLCNLRCTHCFISCSPVNHSHEMMSLEEVKRYLDEARQLGVKEYYLTGGEPFMNKDLFAMLELALKQGPVSILTNALLITPETAARLKDLADVSDYSLELRVSLDGYDAATHDAVRGPGTFDRTLKGVGNLAVAGLNPVITAAEVKDELGARKGRIEFLAFLKSIGLDKPRLKILPILRLGSEIRRSRAYESWESLRGQELTEEEQLALQCSSCRMATSKGVYVCPLLIDSPEARMGETLRDSLRPFELKHQACWTCRATGFSCRT
ncbi:MAG TPA: radical SAM protein [Elusimicrobiota bacterium]|nr:radical SAM protein [Elusimicrobiota bacterium]